ncbi:MAG TPA: hypothetical protein ENJ29_07695 [Bacteroidetes bacterium]|nr:hypothetical protein [Bacteroidota bacterium]
MKIKFIHTIASALLIASAASLLYCGDADCLEGTVSEDCATVVCAILGSHTQQNPDDPPLSEANDDVCPCVCHTQFNDTAFVVASIDLSCIGRISFEMPSCEAVLVRVIYHPPLSLPQTVFA